MSFSATAYHPCQQRAQPRRNARLHACVHMPCNACAATRVNLNDRFVLCRRRRRADARRLQAARRAQGPQARGEDHARRGRARARRGGESRLQARAQAQGRFRPEGVRRHRRPRLQGGEPLSQPPHQGAVRRALQVDRPLRAGGDPGLLRLTDWDNAPSMC
eukprot:4107163-Pleurochrysis_carterae.AAC.1